MKKFRRGIRIFGFILVAVALAAPAGATMRIDYYVAPRWERLKDKDHDAALKTLDIVIFFAPLWPDSSGHVKTPDWFDAALTDLKAKLKPGAQVWLGFGSLENARKNSKALGVFIEEVKSLCAKNGFAGIDLDWENWDTKETRPEDYARVVKQIHDALHPAGTKISISDGFGTAYLQRAKAANSFVDYVMLQAYDGQGVGELKAHVNALMKEGIPAAKICPGLGIYAKKSGATPKTVSYSKILTAGGSPDKNEWKNPDNGVVYPYSGRPLIREKVQYIKQAALGGIFTWEMTLDMPYSSPLSICRTIDAELGLVK